jgi:hypothetical protein
MWARANYDHRAAVFAQRRVRLDAFGPQAFD